MEPSPHLHVLFIYIRFNIILPTIPRFRKRSFKFSTRSVRSREQPINWLLKNVGEVYRYYYLSLSLLAVSYCILINLTVLVLAIADVSTTARNSMSKWSECRKCFLLYQTRTETLFHANRSPIRPSFGSRNNLPVQYLKFQLLEVAAGIESIILHTVTQYYGSKAKAGRPGSIHGKTGVFLFANASRLTKAPSVSILTKRT